MPKKSKNEFKAAFRAIKKPDRPKGVTSKDKSRLERAMDKKGIGEDAFRVLANQLYEDEPDYLVDLIAYKFVKHFDGTGDKRPYWVGLVPPEAFERALTKVVPGGLDDRLTQATLDKAVTSGKPSEKITRRLIYDRDPAGATQFAVEQWTKAKTGKHDDDAEKWQDFFPSGSNRIAPDPEAVEKSKLLVRTIAATGNEAAAATFAEKLSEFVIITDEDLVEGGRGTLLNAEVAPFPLDLDAIVEVATTAPALFASQMLPGMKGKNEFSEIVADPRIQRLLKTKAPKEWAELVSTTPMLRVFGEMDNKIDKDGLTTTAAITNELFDAIVNNRGIPLAYYTNNLTPNSMILSGGSPRDKSMAEDQRKLLGDEAPTVPATQCHQLLHLTTTLMMAYDGMPAPPRIVQDTCDNMLLTKPLATLPGTGLLDRSFSGNVYDDDDDPTGQILFTGDSGRDSHTWLVIDGVPFDPVLGTRGAEVAASVAETFDWIIVDRVARGSKGNFVIKGPSADGKKIPKSAKNTMGFISGYRITADPSAYLDEDELSRVRG